MFTIRPYREEDAEGCGKCFYEGFFTCPINENDGIFLRDYAQVLIENAASLMWRKPRITKSWVLSAAITGKDSVR